MQWYAIDGSVPISGAIAKHHWWGKLTIVVRAPPGHHGGINQLLAEQIRAPGSRRVLASQGTDSTRVKPILRSCLQ